MARRRHITLAVTGLLALPAAAAADKPLDPGTHGKKVDTPALVTDPAPAAQVEKAAPKVQAEVRRLASPGQVKKVAATPAPATGTTTTTPRRTRRSAARPVASRQAPARSNRRGATRGTARADQVGEQNDELQAEQQAARDANVAAAKAKRTAKKPARVTAAAGEDDAPGSSFVLSRAAENVVEVIPGAVLLAMTGLGALVMMLVMRSWFFERRRTRALRANYAATVQALAIAIEAKDHTTGGHIERVRDLGVMLAREMGLNEQDDPQMAYGFLLHDVGKLAIPDAILRKPGRLDDAAWEVMRRHPGEGVRILAAIPFLDRALDVVKYHHERWDGTGYPHGLAGEEIPLWARIFSVVDALDAMTADRPYRGAIPYPEALAEIRSHAGTQFDPAVVEALERIDADRVESLLEPAVRLSVNGNGVPLAELLDPAPVTAGEPAHV